MNYFTSWISERDKVEKEEHISRSDSAKCYLTPQTYEHLQRLLWGFIAYDNCILDYSAHDKYVPGVY